MPNVPANSKRPFAVDRAAIELRGVGKRFGATVALDEVDLTVRRGEVLALLGANGAGKSTLAKIASGVVDPDAGALIVDGRPVALTSPRAAREAGIVIVHQRTDQLGASGLSVAENLILDQLCGGGLGWFARPGARGRGRRRDRARTGSDRGFRDAGARAAPTRGDRARSRGRRVTAATGRAHREPCSERSRHPV